MEDFLNRVDWVALEKSGIANKEEGTRILKLVEVDPSATLNKIRIIIEKLVDFLYKVRFPEQKTEKSVYEKIGDLNKINEFSELIYHTINFLRKAGNVGSHTNLDPKTQVTPLFPMVVEVLRWFVEDKLGTLDLSMHREVDATEKPSIYGEEFVVPEDCAVLEELERVCKHPLPSGNPIRIIIGQIGFGVQDGRVISLSLYNEKLESIPPILKNLKYLKFLNLCGNNLEILPQWIGNFPELQEIDLSYNRFTQIPNLLLQLPKLRIIKINQISFRSPSYKQFRQRGIQIPFFLPTPTAKSVQAVWGCCGISLVLLISSLFIQPDPFSPNYAFWNQNYLLIVFIFIILCGFSFSLSFVRGTTIDKYQMQFASKPSKGSDFRSLPEIEKVAFNHLEIEIKDRLTPLNVPKKEGITRPSYGYVIENGHLVHLSLAGCDLRLIPGEIRNFKFLKILNLQGTKLTELPDWIAELMTLCELNLRDTRIKKFPKTINNLSNLQKLYIPYSPRRSTELEDLRQRGVTIIRTGRFSYYCPLILCLLLIWLIFLP